MENTQCTSDRPAIIRSFPRQYLLYVLMLSQLVYLGSRSGTDPKAILKSLYLSTGPTSACTQILNIVDDNSAGLVATFEAVKTALLNPDQCPAFLQAALEQVEASFFNEELLGHITPGVIPGPRGTQIVAIKMAELVEEATRLGLDHLPILASLGQRIAGDIVSYENIPFAQVFPLDPGNTWALLSNGRDRNPTGVETQKLFSVWLAQPTDGTEVDANGHSRGYGVGLFPQFIKLNGQALAEFPEAVINSQLVWVCIDIQGHYTLQHGPISPEQWYSAVPFLWWWDLGDNGADSFALFSNTYPYLLESMLSARAGDQNPVSMQPLSGIGQMRDGSLVIINLPYHIFSDPIFLNYVGTQLHQLGVVGIGFGDPKMSASGTSRVTDPLHPQPLLHTIDGVEPPDVFSGGPVYLTILEEVG